MADLGDEHTVAGCSEKVLVSIRAFPDGSFAMQPGFSTPGSKYRFEDDHGEPTPKYLAQELYRAYHCKHMTMSRFNCG